MSTRRRLVAVDAFANLFLEDERGAVLRLDTSAGKLEQVSESVGLFQESAGSVENRREWFFEDIEQSLSGQGFQLQEGECLGYKTPIVFSESKGVAGNVYVADLYEYVSFLGDLHLQMWNMPDGEKVRLIIGKRPENVS